MLVIIEDQIFGLQNGTIIAPVTGPLFVQLLENNLDFGDYKVIYGSDLHLRMNMSMSDLLADAINKQEYWVGLYINLTALKTVYDLIGGFNTSTDPYVELQYIATACTSWAATTAPSQYVSRSINKLSLALTEEFASAAYTDLFLSANTSDEQQQIIKQINSTTAPSGLTFFPAFNLLDLRLSPSSVVLGPSEL
ncbi:hypothetical protein METBISCDRAFT_21365 [Metschnikowia bicuspidata]|uniref:DUF3533 domain-containing protein n=1 Tax=Metschnikowia bicuspidata TaxID=27322 RepID=A0A4P9ZI63_9ASCO|nr:hypothetical protein METBISCDRAFT_21365 [Metschnikowia bicuspidata]